MQDSMIDVENALHKALNQRLTSQSPATLKRLYQARQQALENRPKDFWAWLRLTPWVPASLALSTSVLLAVLIAPLSQGQNTVIEPWSETMAMLEVDPGLDMDDELDFYLWLDADS